MNEDYFPQYLASPLQVLWFEGDDLAIMLISFVIASVFHGFWWLLIIVGPWLYIKTKRKYPQSFLKHMMYFSGIKTLKYYPIFFKDKFLE
ncbi:MAG: type IV conjugative transfer system protein TraL [Candidatus Desulfaltia sp.]|jgi:hypothetical protein|nr:type IV conjugative transfer system protein TraL [Candidatus Desulfaltia sp.]